jgi:hypothetical protein
MFPRLLVARRNRNGEFYGPRAIYMGLLLEVVQNFLL